MAQPPSSEGLPFASPAPAPQDYQHIEAGPADFGGLISQGVERLGQGTVTATKFYSQIVAQQAVNNWQDQTTKILYGDPSVPGDTGYYGMKGQAAMDAMPGVIERLHEAQANGLESLALPESQATFSNDIRFLRARHEAQIGQHYDQQSQAWATGVNKASADIALQGVGTAAMRGDQAAIDRFTDAAIGARVKEAQITYGTNLAPAMTQDIIFKARADAVTRQVEAVLPTDPARAAQVLDLNKTRLPPATYDTLFRETQARADQQTVSQSILNITTGNVGPIANPNLPPEAQRFLPALSGGEGNYGSPAPKGDLSATPISNNRYQFLSRTWQSEAPHAGVDPNDRSPAAQDAVAWNTASRTYASNTGRNLQSDIAQGGHEEQIATALNKVWPSLPGGSEQNTSIDQWKQRLLQPGQTGAARNSAIPPRYFDQMQMINHAYQVAQTLPPRQGVQVINGVFEQVSHLNSLEAKADADAQRNLTNVQRDNEATLFGSAVLGQPIDQAMLGNAIRNQQISPMAYNAITAVQQKTAEGQDDPITSIALWDNIANRSATNDDVFRFVTQGKISGKTAIEMVKSLGTQAKTERDHVEKGDYETLKTTLGGHALESGMMDIFGTGKIAHAELWAQAQQEWNHRVVQQGERPDAVLGDMLPRYQKAIPNTPAAWPNPRMGAVHTIEDVADVAAKTKAAFQGGQIDQSTYNTEGDLLERYRRAFVIQAQSAAAAKAAQATGGRRAPTATAPLAPTE